MNKALEPYIGLVEFLGETLGEAYEVVLHDLENLENSVVACVNGSRKVGDPFWGLISEITEEVMEHTLKSGETYRANYQGVSKSGGKLRASSYYIRDEKGEVVGLLGINFNYEMVEELKGKMSMLFNLRDLRFEKREENIEVEEMTRRIIKKTIYKHSAEPHNLGIKEKRVLIEDLDSKGVFRVKGILQEVAEKIQVAEATIYKYLKK